MGDLVLLQADIERIEDEDAAMSGVGSGGAMGASGASDTEEEDSEGEGVSASRMLKGAITNVFSNPKNYDAATRAGRKARTRAISADGSVARSKRTRAASSVSRDSDLVDLDDSLSAGDTQVTLQPTTPTTTAMRMLSASSVGKGGPAPRRRASRVGMSTDLRHGDEEEIEGVWGSRSDWAIDTKIVYKRRITAVFMVRSSLAGGDGRELTCPFVGRQALSELKQYVDLNYTGLSKVLKKCVPSHHSRRLLANC